ncbi:MAG: hypothetical protein ACI9JZ_002217 [Lentimonas sp.]|jgi:hypothetical protein
MMALRAGLQPGGERIVASVEVNGKNTEMVFITNDMDWAAFSVCDLYQSRWAIEVFFKQIKQTLQICDYSGSLRARSGRFARNLGRSKQAIRWQIWSALLLYLRLRFQAWKSDWPHSFARLFTMIPSVVWDRFDLNDPSDSMGQQVTNGECASSRKPLTDSALTRLQLPYRMAVGYIQRFTKCPLQYFLRVPIR